VRLTVVTFGQAHAYQWSKKPGAIAAPAAFGRKRVLARFIIEPG
jgi:hypothetical protein